MSMSRPAILSKSIVSPWSYITRHLAIGAGDVVAFGCQYRGPEEDAPPLIGFHRRGEQPVIVPAPSGTQEGLRNYIGSVAADSSGGIVAASAPKGALVTYWDISS